MADIYANFGSMGEPATWKGGRATAHVGGGVNAGMCYWDEESQQEVCPPGVGDDVSRVIQIH